MYNPSRSNAGARILRRLGVAAALVVSSIAAPLVLHAQSGTGSIAGVITDAAHAAVAGAQVSVVGTRLGGVSDLEGRYRVNGVPAGTHELRVQRIGQKPQSVPSVSVRVGAETKVDVSVIAAPTSLSAVVVSASRRVEKV
ncbi:MAG: carboxypeptidase regulatory-like domain-containing protein, partial [bacterium]